MVTIAAVEDLALLSLDDLMAEAAGVRDRIYGRRTTWSPGVLIPLTSLSHDPCGHCTGAETAIRVEEASLDPEEVLSIARRGAEAGAHEALFGLGEQPDIGYLVAACQLVLDETGLLPHVNLGALTPDDLATLRAVAPSQGLVLRGVNGDIADQLATVEAAGVLRIPFTVCVPVGRGTSRQDRIDVLRRLAAGHHRHGHLQQVAVRTPAVSSEPEEVLETIALARLILPETVSLQAGPAEAENLTAFLDAGVDDWGGVGTQEVEPLRQQAEAHGFVLAPRLTVHPAFARHAEEWIDPALRFAVLDRSDAEGLARDDPGTVLPHRFASRTKPGSGPEVAVIGPRSTAWYSGGEGHPPTLLPGRPSAGGPVREVLEGVTLGQEVGEDELLTLFAARGPEVAAVCEVADDLRQATVGETVTFVRNRNINYTATMEDVVERVVEAAQRGATEVCLQGGIHPEFDGEYYLYLLQAVKAAAPGIHVHGFTALEVFEGARRLGEPLEPYLRRLAAAGLASLPGTAAEILDDEVRSVICPDKITTDEWLDVHRTAHRVGLRSNVTIMFGTVEGPRHWARHLLRTRALQRETGGFTEFVPLPFVHMAAPMYLDRQARRGPTFREALLLHAVGRIAYHGLIDNIGGSWVKLGLAGMAQVLRAGVNDLGGTLMGENISRATGAQHGQELTEDDFRALVEPLGRPLVQRTTLYGRVST